MVGVWIRPDPIVDEVRLVIQPPVSAASDFSTRRDGHPDNVVIVGGGFAGLYTALALARQPGHPSILLLEPNERFLFLPLLYELLSGELRPWEVAPHYVDILAGHGVAWLQDRVDSINATSRVLRTHGGRSVSFGQLVLATGARPNTFGIPGADRHTLGFRDLNDVERLRQLVVQLRRDRLPPQRIIIVGAGPTGVELACKLADMAGSGITVELIERGPAVLPQARAFNREQALMALRRRHVLLRLQTTVTAVLADSIQLQHHPCDADPPREEVLPANGVVWTAGLDFRPPALTPAPEVDRLGRLRCGQDLRLMGHRNIFVAGDLASLPTEDGSSPPAQSLPASAQVAFQQAPVLAENLMRSHHGQPLKPFTWKDLGEMISLGRGEASLCGSGLALAGPAAFQIRRLAYLTRLPGLPQQLRVAAGWLTDWKA